MNPSKSIGGSLPKSSIYLKLHKTSLEQKALIPLNSNMRNHSNLHNRIERSFESAYRSSPHGLLPKMRASRQAQNSTNAPAFSDSSSNHSCKFSTQSTHRREILERVSTLCEQERLSTHKFSSKLSLFRKAIEQNLSTLTPSSPVKPLAACIDLLSKRFLKRDCPKQSKENIY